MLARNQCYGSLSILDRRRHRTTVFIVNFVIVFLLLILSILMFHISVVCTLKMSLSVIVYSLLEKVSTPLLSCQNKIRLLKTLM